ncbi:Nramp family divalent metal transporter [Halobacillus campisalis]|uniref:Nramp family divalent metal transporter n=1 Tax=Halobacillus campisalis TaxID=435909 RepID=A0ABW2K5T3_9BACI|nr:Nramp family divalent metal transporter [Halobacillus campisalis]
MEKESTFKRRPKNVGPGAFVAAAIVGPETVTTASNVGAQFGYALIWALIFSVIATMFLQEMVTRLGVITRKYLRTILREQFSHPVLKWLTMLLIISAIFIGSAAYDAGNIVGGAIGLSSITGLSTRTMAIIIGLTAGVLLWIGKYKIIERVFVGLILTMTLSFVITAIVIQPDMSAIVITGVSTYGFGRIMSYLSYLSLEQRLYPILYSYNLPLYRSDSKEKKS